MRCGRRSKYEGETCLVPTGYPVTKNGQLDCGRVRNAAARGKQNGSIWILKRNGLCSYMSKCSHDSDVCT